MLTHRPITVAAHRNNTDGTVVVRVDAPVSGMVGLRLYDEATGCGLDRSTAKLDGAAVTVAVVGEERGDAAAAAAVGAAVHPTVAAQHGYIAVPAGAHTVSASFSAGCVAHLAASDEAAVEQEAAGDTYSILASASTLLCCNHVSPPRW